MRQKYLETLISFCIGVSWAVSFFISTYLFMHALPLGVFVALILALAGLAFGLVFVAFFEGLSMLQDIALEKKEQTKTLKKILESLSHHPKADALDEKIPNH